MTSAKENFEPNINFSVFKTEKSSIENLNMRNTVSSSPYEYRSCFNQIDKKTNRGRKEKNPLPKDVLKCEICLQYKDISKEELIFCCICKCLFHKSCNPQYEVLPSPSNKILLYRCIRCSQAAKLHKPITDFSCFICNHSENVLNYSTQSRLFYHQPCLFFINELNSLDKEEVYREAIRKWRYKNSCKYCGEKLSKLIAVIKCSKSQCKEYYHIPCAIDKGMIFDLNFMKEFYKKSSFNQIPFFCANHNKKISRQYKDYINEKFNEIEKEKQNKKTFQNDSEFEEEKEDFENDENEMKYEDEDEKDEKVSEIYKSIANMSIDEIDAIAVTEGPGLIGSLLIGVTCATTLSYIYNKPLVPVHHIAGHIYANNLASKMKFPLIALVISGGHTELIYMKEDYSFKKIGGTLDDAVGECYDKVARVIGLNYPGGPQVDKLAHLGQDTYNLPLPLDLIYFQHIYNFLLLNLVYQL